MRPSQAVAIARAFDGEGDIGAAEDGRGKGEDLELIIRTTSGGEVARCEDADSDGDGDVVAVDVGVGGRFPVGSDDQGAGEESAGFEGLKGAEISAGAAATA
jgi:hypothetical protein